MGYIKERANRYSGETIMGLKGIIITGTSGAGKSTIAEKLASEQSQYKIARALTTREKRDDDRHYIYIDDQNFEKSRPLFFTCAEYRGKKYAITKPEISGIYNQNKYAILVISPKSLNDIPEEEKPFFLSFFIDAPDDELDKRIKNRDKIEISEGIIDQRKKDREYSDIPNYIIRNSSIEKAALLIKRLVLFIGQGSFLSKEDIELMMDNGMLIDGGTKENIQGASYDLRLGDQYYYGGKIKTIGKNNLILTIEPYDYAIVSSKEEICLPKDVVAHFGLTVGLFCQGIILSNGLQVDPGFRGTLFCLLFNTSNRPVSLKRNEHYATIEFTKMSCFAEKYKGHYQYKRDIIDVIPVNAMRGAINELKKEVEELKQESKNLQNIYISVIAIIVAAISILLILK